MQPSIDFLAATPKPPFDFVSALSAERGCDACHELDASVYALTCASCSAALCQDCARLRADASVACLACHEHSAPTPLEPQPARVPSALASALAVLARGRATTRDASLRGWIALRNLPVRRHSDALLLALTLVYGVARAEQRDA
jgi:hypothetical protein